MSIRTRNEDAIIKLTTMQCGLSFLDVNNRQALLCGINAIKNEAVLKARIVELEKRPEFDLSTVHGREQQIISNLRAKGL